MKITLTLLCIVLVEQLAYSQSQPSSEPHFAYCVKTKSLTRTKLKNTYPFDRTKKIQLVSFKPDYESGPMKNGTLDSTKFIESKTLRRKDENNLVDILYNYNFDPKVNKDSIVTEAMMCYEPRNAVLFKNNKNEIVAYLEICFECLRHKESEGLLLGEFCQDKYSRLKDFFGQIGIKYGLTELE
ncbi:hypothetical protein WSM22_46910 [Cytophagales bacterium WSM2-2]|nr:hypothetical protein WSM22_46910 [Cytophagales bacterium WSM2-2]